MRIGIAEAIERLKSGQIVAIPTETVYGLAGSLAFPNAIDQIYALKRRPNNNPLIIHVSGISQVISYAPILPPGFAKLAEAFWPGPLTLISPIIPETIPASARANLPTAAFRMPEHPLANTVIEAAGPLVAPSANISGRPSATRPEHVEEDFGGAFPVLDGGHCTRGVESTILLHKNGKWRVIRLGSIPPESFHPILGYEPEVEHLKPSETPLCPGQLYRHYAPAAKIHIGDTKKFLETTPIILGFKEREYPKYAKVYILGSLEDPLSVSENLYATFRQLDLDRIAAAWVDMDFPHDGIWATIRERIKKASIG